MKGDSHGRYRLLLDSLIGEAKEGRLRARRVALWEELDVVRDLLDKAGNETDSWRHKDG